jgi:hypothetical protein
MLGGLAIAAYGFWTGMHLALTISLLLAALTLLILSRINIPIATDQASSHMLSVWHSLPKPMRWLLASDIFIRTCEGLVDVFLVLYALNVLGIGAPAYGILIAVQMVTAILSYIPAASMADRLGRKPLVVATFVALQCFPSQWFWHVISPCSLPHLSSGACVKWGNPRVKQ